MLHASVNHLKRLRHLIEKEHTYPNDRFEGRGIITLGGGRYFTSAWVLICSIRDAGCTLPIELWYYGDQEMPPVWRSAALEKGNIEVKDVLEYQQKYPSKVRKFKGTSLRLGWALKPYTIINSNFKEVLFLDGDNMVLRDPEFLFYSNPYKNKGAIFWRDFHAGTCGATRTLLRSKIWEILDLKKYGPAFESGQIVMNKEECWKQLQITLFMNENPEFYYQHIHGDKDTFLLSWRLTKKPYHLMPPLRKLYRCMVQNDFRREPLFQHRWGAKWKLYGDNYNIEGFLKDAECKKYIAELRDHVQKFKKKSSKLI